VDYAAENQGVLYVLGVSLPLRRSSSPLRQAVRSRFYGFALGRQNHKELTTILHAVTAY
jgi:hypothetical protein